jgi:hypothetical protein
MWAIFVDGYLSWTSKHHILTFQHDGHVGGYMPKTPRVVTKDSERSGGRGLSMQQVVVIAELRGSVDEVLNVPSLT